MMGLTNEQSLCLYFIGAYVESNDISPSYDEIRDHLGLSSKQGVHRLVTALEERGFIRRFPKRARAIQIIARDGVIVCPHCGAAAGSRECVEAARRGLISESAPQDGSQIVGTLPGGGVPR